MIPASETIPASTTMIPASGTIPANMTVVPACGTNPAGEFSSVESDEIPYFSESVTVTDTPPSLIRDEKRFSKRKAVPERILLLN